MSTRIHFPYIGRRGVEYRILLSIIKPVEKRGCINFKANAPLAQDTGVQYFIAFPSLQKADGCCRSTIATIGDPSICLFFERNSFQTACWQSSVSVTSATMVGRTFVLLSRTDNGSFRVLYRRINAKSFDPFN